MNTHHCSKCYILLFMCQLNAYPTNIDTISIGKETTINLRENSTGFVLCDRCNYIVGEINLSENYNIFLERIKVFNTQTNRFEN